LCSLAGGPLHTCCGEGLRLTSLATPAANRAARFYQAAIGKKAVMALTGVILFGYVLAHLLGNLQIYSSDPEQINRYAAFLHDPGRKYFLWAARIFLLVAVALHITASIQLWLLKREARPIAYYKKDDVPTAYAARTMLWSGPIILAFVIFHVLHLTVGSVFPLRELGPNQPDVRANLVGGFQHPAVAGFYIFAMVLLSMHLYHGLWSMFQSVGLSHPGYTPAVKHAAAVFAILIGAGNISIPLTVLMGLVT
jgi:succinate dehydrogenase / fumarate reductase, cytochrome b subunit